MKKLVSILILTLLIAAATLFVACDNTKNLDDNSKLEYSDLEILGKDYDDLTEDEQNRLITMQEDMTVDEMKKYKSDLKRLYIQEMAEAYSSEKTAEEMFEEDFDYKIRKKKGELTAEEMEKEKEREEDAQALIDKTLEGSRQNPYPFKTTVDLENDDTKISVTINDLIRGDKAWDMMYKENEFNDKPGEGKEYIIANITIKLHETTEEPFQASSYLFKVVSEDGFTYDSGGVVPEELYNELYTGGETTGNIACIVNKDDNILLKFDDSIFFATK